MYYVKHPLLIFFIDNDMEYMIKCKYDVRYMNLLFGFYQLYFVIQNCIFKYNFYRGE